MRLEKTISKALKRVEEDSYRLSLLVSKRANDIKAGSPILLEGVTLEKYKTTDIALMEIADGLVELESIADYK